MGKKLRKKTRKIKAKELPQTIGATHNTKATRPPGKEERICCIRKNKQLVDHQSISIIHTQN
jgi:hypothetical protein